MEFDDTKKFLLVRAVEEADREGGVIPLDDRSVREGEGDDPNKLLDRADRLFGNLEAAHPRQVGAAVSATASHSWVKIVIILVAFAVGIATKQLGPEKRVNVLAFPLLGVLAWNALVYLFAIGGAFFHKAKGSALLGGVVSKFAERAMRRIESKGDRELESGLSRFVGAWYQLTASARVCSLRSSLHLGAAALSVGVVAGMYWNGLAFQYLAAWESTFLGPDGVHGLFAALFAPASAISGIPLPGIEEIRAMELKTGDEGVSAAPWIHLFAITVGMFVVVPRLLMAWRFHRKSRAQEAAIDFREVAPEYIDRLLRTREGGNLIARLFPHRMELGSKERDRLRALVHQIWGGKLVVEFEDPILYGDEDEAQFEAGDYQLLVLNFSATPEEESQGRLVKRFRDQLSRTGLVILDAQPFRERFGGLGEFERRKEERRSAWESILGRSGVGFAIFDGSADETRLAASDVMLKPRGTSDV